VAVFRRECTLNMHRIKGI